MANLWQTFRQFLAWDEHSPGQSAAVSVTATRRIALPQDQRLPALKRTQQEVRLQPKPYWQEMRWVRYGNDYRGSYHGNGRSFPGRIEHLYEDTWDFYVRIEQPWPALLNHPKWPCFAAVGTDGWRKVHWHIKPASLDSGIQSIEETLAQTL